MLNNKSHNFLNRVLFLLTLLDVSFPSCPPRKGGAICFADAQGLDPWRTGRVQCAGLNWPLSRKCSTGTIRLVR